MVPIWMNNFAKKSFILQDDQIERYSRQILLKEIGSKGQRKLLDAHVTVIGAGGLGCPTVQMLASSGIGHIRIYDADKVSLSNLPRQILHFTNDLNKYKVQSIAEKVAELNPDVHIEAIPEFITQKNITNALQGSDYIIEASDNPFTKFLVNDACVHLGIPFVIAGVVQSYGQLISVVPEKTPCYRCVFRHPVEEDSQASCSGAGVFSTVPQFAGILQANETLKYLLGIPSKYVNHIVTFDLFEGCLEKIPIKKSPDCAACVNPTHPYYQVANYHPSLSNINCERN